MDWLWPDSLLLLGSVPLVIFLYIRTLRRRRFALRYSSLGLLREALPGLSWWRRHLTFVLFIIAFISLVVAMGRPIIPVNAFSGQTTIMLTLDISKSMCMRDIYPTRLDVAKTAALSFVGHPVTGTQVGVVAFAGFAELAQRPTTDVSVLEYTIQNLVTATSTAIGSGILRSLDAIAEVDQRVAKSQAIDKAAVYLPEDSSGLKFSAKNYLPHIIVLLTDGESNSGPDPLLAAEQAAERGIRIFTVGFGTPESAVMDCRHTLADQTYSSPMLESQPGSQRSGTTPDELTLQQIAKMTGGKYYPATSAGELQMVFQSLHTYVTQTNQTVEMSVYFTAFGVIVIMIAFILSLFWHPLL